MGKGDRRSRRGKIFRGTFGKSRKHKRPTEANAYQAPPKPIAPPEEVTEAPKKKRVSKKKAE